MSLLTLSKRILGKESKPSLKKAEKTTAGKKKVSAAAASARKKKQTVDAGAFTTGVIGLTPLISEKGTMQQFQNTAVFRVLPHATKGQIAQVIEKRYGVKVKSVRTSLSHPKIRRRGASEGKTNRWKKAYVTVDNIQALIANA